MNQNELNNSIAVASMRLASIQPALNNTYPDMNKKAYYVRIAKQPFKFPDGHCKCQYKNVGFFENKDVDFPTCLFSTFNYLLSYTASDP